MGPLVFETLEPQSVDVTIGDKSYVLTEGTHDAVIAFRKLSAQGLTFTDGKLTGSAEGNTESRSLLVQKCLRELKPDGERGLVSIGFVRALPHQVVEKLFDAVKELTPRLIETGGVDMIDKQIAMLQKERDRLTAGDEAKN